MTFKTISLEKGLERLKIVSNTGFSKNKGKEKDRLVFFSKK